MVFPCCQFCSGPIFYFQSRYNCTQYTSVHLLIFWPLLSLESFVLPVCQFTMPLSHGSLNYLVIEFDEAFLVLPFESFPCTSLPLLWIMVCHTSVYHLILGILYYIGTELRLGTGIGTKYRYVVPTHVLGILVLNQCGTSIGSGTKVTYLALNRCVKLIKFFRHVSRKTRKNIKLLGISV